MMTATAKAFREEEKTFCREFFDERKRFSRDGIHWKEEEEEETAAAAATFNSR